MTPQQNVAINTTSTKESFPWKNITSNTLSSFSPRPRKTSTFLSTAYIISSSWILPVAPCPFQEIGTSIVTMSDLPASKHATTASIETVSTQHVPLPTDLINGHGVSGAHVVHHGPVPPRLAPGVRFYGGTGPLDPVDSNGKLGNSIASHNGDKHLQGQKSKSLLNAAAPAFVPTFETGKHRHQGVHTGEACSTTHSTAQDPMLAHTMAWQYSAAQPLTATEYYPSIQHYPVAQQLSAPGYPLPQDGVPPYIYHQYLTPQYGVQLEPSSPMQMIPMLSSVQQAMDYQRYLAERAQIYNHTEHQYTHPKPFSGKSEQKKSKWQKRRAASHRRGSQEREYIGYYFLPKDKGQIGHTSSHANDVSQYLPVVPLEGYHVLGSDTKSSNWDMEKPHGFLPLLSSSALASSKRTDSSLHAMGNGMQQ